MDVCGFITGAAYSKFANFMQMLAFKMVPNACVPPSEEYAKFVKAFWRGSTFVSRHDDERMVQPFVHLVLVQAAMMAENEASKRSFVAVAEPTVMKNAENRLADEAVFEQTDSDVKMASTVECISEGKCLRVLLELKGTHVFPYKFTAKAAEPAFSQLFQEVALAWHSQMWQGELLCGLATLDFWYLLKVRSSSVNGKLRLKLQDDFCYKVGFHKRGFIESANDLAQFLKNILILKEK